MIKSLSKYFRFFLVVSLMGVIMAYADDPRAIYREIYAQITSAEAKSGTGQIDQASKEFQEILFHLENFQKQFPDWEPEIVKFRIQYARNQVKQLQLKKSETAAQPQPAPLPTTAAAPQPAPIPIEPTLIPTIPVSTPASSPPPAPAALPPAPQPQPPAPIAQAPQPILPPPPVAPTPAPIAQVSQPVPPSQPAARPTKILPLPEASQPAPQAQAAPAQVIAQAPVPPQPAPIAPQPQPQPTAMQMPPPQPASTFRPPPTTTSQNLVLSQPALPSSSPLASLNTANLQSMAREVETRISRLENENKALRASLAETQSRADVSSSYVKVLTRENEFLQDKLNRELRKLEELRQILNQQFAEHSARWNALQQRVRELVNDPEIAPPQHLIVPPANEPTYTVPQQENIQYQQVTPQPSETEDPHNSSALIETFLTPQEQQI